MARPAATLHPIRNLVILWLGWALLMVAFPIFVHARFDIKRPDTVFTWTGDATMVDPHDVNKGVERALDYHIGWDSEYYLSIARRGYDDPQMRAIPPNDNPDNPLQELKGDQPTWTTLNYAFFPAYPLAMRALSWPMSLFGLSALNTDIASGIVIALLGSLAAMLGLYALGRDTDGGDADEGLRAAFYLLVWPASTFLAQVYTEGLFVGLSFGALAMLRRKQWVWAGLLAALATWTRATGVLLLVPFAWTWLAEGRLAPFLRKPTLRAFGLGLCAAAPAIAYVIWRLILGGKFQMVETHYFGRDAFDVKDSWRNWVIAWHDLVGGGPAIRAYNFVEFFGVAAGLLTTILLWRRDKALALYGLAIIVTALTSGAAMGMHRYVLSAPALFLVPARWGRSPAFDRLWTLGGGLVMSVFAILFSFGFWAG